MAKHSTDPNFRLHPTTLLSNESRNDKQRLCFEAELHPRADSRFSVLKSSPGVEHQLKDKWTLWREDSVLTMQPQSDYTVAHMPRPHNASHR